MIDSTTASMTAICTALMRAAHTRLDRPTLIDDPWGDRLVRDADRDAVRELTGNDDLDRGLRAHPSYGTVILRARYAEDSLHRAIANGVRQSVIIGAGLDSYALRSPRFARELEILEIDDPATQELKRRRLADLRMRLPARLHFVASGASACLSARSASRQVSVPAVMLRAVRWPRTRAPSYSPPARRPTRSGARCRR